MTQQPRTPTTLRLTGEQLASIEPQAVLTADRAASVAHDYMWPLSKDTAPTQKEASDAIWAIHEALRPLTDQAAAIRSAARGGAGAVIPFAAALLGGFLLGLVAMLVVIDRLFGGSGPTLHRRALDGWPE